jgi:hypothetical protein
LIAQKLGLILNEGTRVAMHFCLERLEKELRTILVPLPPGSAAAQAPGKWSANEILEHLYLTYTGTTKGFQRCLENGKPLARGATAADHLRRWAVIRWEYFPSGRKSPKQAAPRGLDAEMVRRDIFAKLAEMDAVIDQAAQRYGAATRLLDHPILGPLTADEWCRFHWVHGHHHAKQIARLFDAATSDKSRRIS